MNNIEIDEEKLLSSNLESNAERKGTLVGTVNYMAPEMIKDNAASMATDIWCLGCIIFKILTGQVPFTGTQTFKVF
jgi:serine/threonine protein kinase